VSPVKTSTRSTKREVATLLREAQTAFGATRETVFAEIAVKMDVVRSIVRRRTNDAVTVLSYTPYVCGCWSLAAVVNVSPGVAAMATIYPKLETLRDDPDAIAQAIIEHRIIQSALAPNAA